MKKKRSVGLILLGLLFFFMGIYTFSGALNTYRMTGEKHHRFMKESYDETLKNIESVETEEHRQKLISLGNWEEFQKQITFLKKQVIDKKKQYLKSVPHADQHIILTGFITAALCFLSGGSLITYRSWARGCVFLTCAFFCLYYTLIIMRVYQSIYMATFIVDSINIIEKLINPESPEIFTGIQGPAWHHLTFRMPFVIFHFFVLTFVGGTILILTRKKIIEFLEKT